ncbi:MAG: hypothetical protein A3G64_02825 [Candidatus Liptonbacteria bacterium RIFCSPLOWO2_12_FULL_60_15]|uniref:Amidohydrolase-related domain-containing protein n=2 Tax=Candidatus Liptoniibacteriota TaxID=1817909 RepID=A0A1G2CMR4_9BACT|nr:MAG: hypothetical protein A3E09_01605 [Candidatus Liptonbacteria bacterium RIFCSPHIGHO2_12_FULL_60_13]OGZ02696.1 MAG: hypothetical protein A3G64_02825 [Candidatus Liptonbacteria bacterium RIFCSPLOWO2_12_FULL_60_15]
MTTLLIKGVQIVDGTGRPPFKGDIFIKDKKISAIGPFGGKSADAVIDGLGAFAAPGFIDVNTDSDHTLTLFSNPSQREFLLQGVTTIVGGHCGASLAPLLYGTLESIRKWADPSEINVDWHTMGEFLGVLSKKRLGVNFATLIGHATIRRALIGEAFRDLTENERKVFAHVVERALEEGALGLSTGLGYAHSNRVPLAEILDLLSVVAKYGGIYTTHLRDEDKGLVSSVRETIAAAEKAQVKTVMSHLRPLRGFEKEYDEAMQVIEGAPVGVRFDSYPFATSSLALYTFLPKWAQDGGLEVMLSHVRTPAIRERIREEMPAVNDQTFIIANAPRHEYLHGRPLGEFAEHRGLTDAKEALLELMELTGLRATIMYQNIDAARIQKSMLNDRSFVGSNSGGSAPAKGIKEFRSLVLDRAVRTFPRFLEITAEAAWPIEEAVKKITWSPAQFCGIRERGAIREGMCADITVFQASEIKHVVVNGTVAVKDGQTTDALGGEVIRR